MNPVRSLVVSCLVALPLAALSLGCDSSKDKAAAVSSAAPEAALVGGTAYVISPAGSKVEFVGAKVTGKHEGSFQKFSGTARVPEGDVTKGQVTIAIEMGSVKSDSDKLTGHLMTADLFDVAKFPQAKFTSTSIKAGGEKGASHTVTGNLELHGVTKSVTFPATIKVSADKAEVAAEFSINRKDFGIIYPGMPDDLIKDDVLIKLTVSAPKG